MTTPPTTDVRTPTGAPARPAATRTLVCATAFMVVLDTTTLVAALASIARNLGLDTRGSEVRLFRPFLST